MKIAVVGGGFTGLSAAYFLAKSGHQVTVFEKEDRLGGLAAGFKRPGWDWYLEGSYHHLFANDTAIFNLIKELGLSSKLILKRPITATYMAARGAARGGLPRGGAGKRKERGAPGGVPFRSTVTALAKKILWRDDDLDLDGARTRQADQGASSALSQIYQLDSPAHLFTFPYLSPLDKLRTAALLAFCKLNPFWQPLEAVTAKDFFSKFGGIRAWQILWEPLMYGKFDDMAETIAASWLWARIKKRTPRLAYIEGGFHTVVEALESAITKNGGKIYTGREVSSIKSLSFNRILLTISTPVALKLFPNLAFGIGHLALKVPHLHAQTLILETREPILKDVYWLNVADRSFPFLAVVAHTNFMDKKHYGNHHLTYFGNYLPAGHPYLSLNKKQLLKEFLPFIKRLNPSFSDLSLITYHLSLGFAAQPVHQLHYSQRAPKLDPPAGAPGIYLANLDSIYPWDRGTNYAVELGIKAAVKIMADAK
ncbi:MAG: FAD-dependent oxidoreductase [Patescibacteria group bacterium]